MEVTVLTYRSVYIDRRVHNPETFGTKVLNTGDIYIFYYLGIILHYFRNQMGLGFTTREKVDIQTNYETFGTKVLNTGDIYISTHLKLFVLFGNNLALF